MWPYILDGLIESKDIDTIPDSIPSGKVKKKREHIKASLGRGLDDVSRMLVKDTLELLDHLEEKVSDASQEILGRLQERAKDLAIVMFSSRNGVCISLDYSGRDRRLS